MGKILELIIFMIYYILKFKFMYFGEVVMKNKKLVARIMAGAMAAFMLFGVVAGFLIYLI